MAEPVKVSPREDLVQEVTRRLAALGTRLDDLQAKGVTTRPDDVDRELAYVDRAVGAAPRAVRREIDGEVERMRVRINTLKRKNVGCALAGLDDNDSIDSNGRSERHIGRNNSLGSGSPAPSFKMRQNSLLSGRSARTFMQKTASAIGLRSWKSVDDEREHRAFVDLAARAEELSDLSAEVAGHIEAQQGDLDHVAQETTQTKQNVQSACSSVADAARSQARRWNYIGAGVALLVVILGLLVAWFTSSDIILPVVIGLVIGSVVHLMALVGKSTQARGLNVAKDRVQQAGSSPPLAAEVAERIYREGLEGEIRLLELLDEMAGPGVRLTDEMTLRSSGNACKITFEVGADASAAFRMLDRLRDQYGGLDPGCQAMWARPVDTAGTSLRYSVHDVGYANRDFLVALRSGPVGAENGKSQYLIAATSLSPETAALVEAETGRRWVVRGDVGAVGVSVEDVNPDEPMRLSTTWPVERRDRRSRIDLIVDVDLRLCCCGRSAVRRHAVAMSQQLASMFLKEARTAGSVEMCEF